MKSSVAAIVGNWQDTGSPDGSHADETHGVGSLLAHHHMSGPCSDRASSDLRYLTKTLSSRCFARLTSDNAALGFLPTIFQTQDDDLVVGHAIGVDAPADTARLRRVQNIR